MPLLRGVLLVCCLCVAVCSIHQLVPDRVVAGAPSQLRLTGVEDGALVRFVQGDSCAGAAHANARGGGIVARGMVSAMLPVGEYRVCHAPATASYAAPTDGDFELLSPVTLTVMPKPAEEKEAVVTPPEAVVKPAEAAVQLTQAFSTESGTELANSTNATSTTTSYTVTSRVYSTLTKSSKAGENKLYLKSVLGWEAGGTAELEKGSTSAEKQTVTGITIYKSNAEAAGGSNPSAAVALAAGSNPSDANPGVIFLSKPLTKDHAVGSLAELSLCDSESPLRFINKKVEESTFAVGAYNTITVKIQPSKEIPAGTAIQISGLINSITSDSDALALSGADASKFDKGKGQWQQSTGSLTITTATPLPCVSQTQFSFMIQNPSQLDAARHTAVRPSIIVHLSNTAPPSEEMDGMVLSLKGPLSRRFSEADCQSYCVPMCASQGAGDCFCSMCPDWPPSGEWCFQCSGHSATATAEGPTRFLRHPDEQQQLLPAIDNWQRIAL